MNKKKLMQLLRKDLIGLTVEIVEAKNKSNLGIKGEVIDETKNTIVVNSNNRNKRLLKDTITLLIIAEKEKIKINGKLLKGKVEERVKKW